MPFAKTVSAGTFIEREPYEKGFTDFFERNIKERLVEVEKQRFVFLDQYRRRKKVAVALYSAELAITIFLFYIIQDESVLLLSFFVAVFIFGWMRQPVSKYHSHVKEGIISKLIKFFGTLAFSENGKIDGNILRDASVTPVFQHYTGSDHISGEYDGVPMEMCEVKLENEGRKNNKHIVVFIGEIFHIRLRKPFHGRTVVKRDGGLLGNLLNAQFSGSQRVKLEDPKFEGIFDVFSTDQVEARYLLTTAFMERLLALRDMYSKNGSIKCEFFSNHLFIMVETGTNLFEVGDIEKSCLDTEDIHRFLGQMHSVFQVIDVLKLNKYTGL